MSYYDGGEDTVRFKKQNTKVEENTDNRIRSYAECIDKKVIIVDLGLHGHIKEVRITRSGPMYLVRYVYNMDMREAYFYCDEIRFVV